MNSRKLFMYWISLPYELFLTFIYQVLCYNKRLLEYLNTIHNIQGAEWHCFFDSENKTKNTNDEIILKSAQLVSTYLGKCTTCGNICAILENGCSFDCREQMSEKCAKCAKFREICKIHRNVQNYEKCAEFREICKLQDSEKCAEFKRNVQNSEKCAKFRETCKIQRNVQDTENIR